MEHIETPDSITNLNGSSDLGFQSPTPDPNPSYTDPDQTSDGDENNGKIHEELQNQLNLKEGEEKEGDWDDSREKDGKFSGGDYGWDDYPSERVLGDEAEEQNEGRSYNGGDRSQQLYPVRPEAEDCAYYMRTGSCKFGPSCRFNHPVTRKNHVAKEKVNEGEETTDKPTQTECKYYLRTGGCKYGKACRYNHSRAKASMLPETIPTLPILELNFLGLPIRPGEKECLYYMRKGSCKYGSNCIFNHPDPTTVGGSDSPSVFVNGGSTTAHKSSQSSVTSWSSPRALNEAAPYVPVVFSPTQGVPPHNPEWNGYQAAIYQPPEGGMHPPPTYVLNKPTAEINAYAHHRQQIAVDEFPERPGQPECAYFLRTGDCKFKSNCKYHHPKNRISKSPPCALSDKGLPLRPDQNTCLHYSRYGICKFGPACKFNHPVEAVSSTGCDDQPTPISNSVSIKEPTMAESGNENGNGNGI